MRFADALRRGPGRAAREAPAEPTAAAAVIESVWADHRWDRQVDERAVYLAKLVRDLSVPVIDLLAAREAGGPPG